LREVLAAADHDFVLTEPASKLNRLREKLRTASNCGSRRTGRRGRRYLSVLAAGLFIATAAAILLNALVWQKTRHPAPLFSRAAPAAPAKEPTIGGMSAVPAARLLPAVPPVQAHDTPVEKPSAQMAAGGHPPQTRVNSSPPRDVISQWLKPPPAPPARPTTKAAASAAPSKLVLAAQRALVKLGFVLNPDGVVGATTRLAIERYERDHGFPVRGDLSRAIIRRLIAETGITIN
jgi:hypothetical protein